MAAAILERVRERLRSARSEIVAEGWPAYRHLLGKLANDQDVDGHEIEAVLEQNEKTVDDLERDVDTIRQRIKYRADLDAAAALSKRQAAIAKELEKQEAEFQAARHKYITTTEPLRAEAKQVERGLMDAGTARIMLTSTSIDPTISRMEQEIQARRKPLADRHRQLTDELNPSRSRNVGNGHVSLAWKLGALKGKLNRDGSGEPEVLDSIKRAERFMKEMREELAGIDRELAKLDRESAALSDARLNP